MNNKWSVLLLVALAAAFALYFLTKERQFVWDDDTTFLHEDDEPFGCQLFDKMAEATLPNGYSLFDGDLDSLLEKGKERCALLIFTHSSLPHYFLNDLVAFTKKGNKVMLVTDDQDAGDEDEDWDFDFSTLYDSYFSKNKLKDALMGYGSLAKVWMTAGERGDTLLIPETLFRAHLGSVIPAGAVVTSYRMMNEWVREYEETEDVDSVYYYEDGYYADVERGLSFYVKEGKGRIYVVTNTLLFTNYGVLDRDISRYIGYHLGMVADLPVFRVTHQSLRQSRKGDDDYWDEMSNRSPLDHLLSYRPLRWAFYTLLLAAVLFMVFTARRRQRVMPIVERPANRNLEFVRLLGTIYYRRHDNHDLFMKKYTYFREELRRKQLIDLDNMQVEVNARTLAQLMGVEEKDLNDTLRLLKAVEASTGELGNEQLLDCVHRMNDILKHL